MIPLSVLILQKEPIYAFLSVLLFIFMEILDHTDGMLACAKKISSVRGQFIEVIADDLTASPNFLLGIMIVYTADNQLVLYSFLVSLSCERLFFYMKQNTSLEPEVIKEVAHLNGPEDFEHSKTLSGKILDSLRAIFILSL